MRVPLLRITQDDAADALLARAWTLVTWRCWQDAVPYDPNRHGALNRYLINQDAAAAA